MRRSGPPFRWSKLRPPHAVPVAQHTWRAQLCAGAQTLQDGATGRHACTPRGTREGAGGRAAVAGPTCRHSTVRWIHFRVGTWLSRIARRRRRVGTVLLGRRVLGRITPLWRRISWRRRLHGFLPCSSVGAGAAKVDRLALGLRGEQVMQGSGQATFGPASSTHGTQQDARPHAGPGHRTAIPCTPPPRTCGPLPAHPRGSAQHR